ncbi:MAG TPA: hypothetical protein VFH17_03430 [Coriobacteriia bacterium]|nr:hypothetical protein [Coriobacteriia bacterium]
MRRFAPRWWTVRTPAEKRYVLLRAGLVVLAGVVLVGVPGYLASRPQFMERYPGLETAYRTWSGSLHSSVSCQECHVTPGVVPRAVYAARMLGEFYISLAPVTHEPGLLGTPTNEACNECHMELRTVSPAGDLNIPHRAHVEMLGMACVDCHEYVVHEPGPHGANTPSMQDCLSCHDGVTADDDCAACHTDKDPPDTHFEPQWVFGHSKVADEGCNECHDWTENWCGDCHAQRPASHGDDWRAVHGDRVETRRNCEVCHTGEFCVRCHGIVPPLNYDSSVTLVR